MTVKSGATLILKFDKDRDYAFTKPIYLEGGTIEINGGGGSGIIKGLDVRGKGYRDLPRGDRLRRCGKDRQGRNG